MADKGETATADQHNPSVTKIAIIVGITLLVIIVAVIIYRYMAHSKRVDTALIKTPKLVRNVSPIDATTAKLSKVGIEYTYNIWVKISDPGTSTKPKCILYRANTAPSATTMEPANPSIWLYPADNKLMVRVSTLAGPTSPLQTDIYPDYNTAATQNSSAKYTIVNPLTSDNSSNAKRNKPIVACDVGNIPLQRWVQITVVLWNQTLDVYINGKLVRSCVLPGMPLHDASALKKIFVGGGQDPSLDFNGYVSRLRYFNKAITAQEVMDLYKKGPIAVQWWWQVMKNRVAVSLDIGQD